MFGTKEIGMSVLDINWRPKFGAIFIWFAMDKFGRIGVMVNNCFGDIPICILRIKDVNIWLDHINEYMWEESEIYNNYPNDKGSDFKADLYSSWGFKKKQNREEVEKEFLRQFEVCGRGSEVSLVVNRGFFVYYAIEGSCEGEDSPVGYSGKTKMGDYYRFLVPSIYASILDFPKDLHHVIAVSPTLDFTRDRVLDNSKINDYFPYCYSDKDVFHC